MGARDYAASEARGRQRRGRSAGQALVEFSMVVMAFLVAFFAIVEFSLIMSSLGSYNFATREAARLGSVVGRTDPNADQSIINAITSRVQSLVAAQVSEIDIYRADPLNGNCYNSTPSDVSVDDPTCMKDKYSYSGLGVINTPCTGTTAYCSWPPDIRNDTLANADYLGVRVLYKYTFIEAFFTSLGAVLNLSTYSVQRIEPQDFQGTYVSPPMAAHISAADGLALAAAAPAWKREEEGGIG